MRFTRHGLARDMQARVDFVRVLFQLRDGFCGRQHHQFDVPTLGLVLHLEKSGQSGRSRAPPPSRPRPHSERCSGIPDAMCSYRWAEPSGLLAGSVDSNWVRTSGTHPWRPGAESAPPYLRREQALPGQDPVLPWSSIWSLAMRDP